MIKFYGFGLGVGQLDLSFFVMKVMILLCMVGLFFEKINGIVGVCKVLCGKLFYIEDNGWIIFDLCFIKCYFVEIYGVDFFGGYDEKILMMGLFVECMLEELSYFFVVECWWICFDGWLVMCNVVFGLMFVLVCFFIVLIVCCSVLNFLKGQGIVRMSDVENDRLCVENLCVIVSFFDNKLYLFGIWLSGFDVMVLVFVIVVMLWVFLGFICDVIF